MQPDYNLRKLEIRIDESNVLFDDAKKLIKLKNLPAILSFVTTETAGKPYDVIEFYLIISVASKTLKVRLSLNTGFVFSIDYCKALDRRAKITTIKYQDNLILLARARCVRAVFETINAVVDEEVEFIKDDSHVFLDGDGNLVWRD